VSFWESQTDSIFFGHSQDTKKTHTHTHSGCWHGRHLQMPEAK